MILRVPKAPLYFYSSLLKFSPRLNSILFFHGVEGAWGTHSLGEGHAQLLMEAWSMDTALQWVTRTWSLLESLSWLELPQKPTPMRGFWASCLLGNETGKGRQLWSVCHLSCDHSRCLEPHPIRRSWEARDLPPLRCWKHEQLRHSHTTSFRGQLVRRHFQIAWSEQDTFLPGLQRKPPNRGTDGSRP